MGLHRAVICGGGRIGIGYKWPDLGYTHAGAMKSLKDRVELIGVVEPNEERAKAAYETWGVPTSPTIDVFRGAADVVSVCVQPEHQTDVLRELNWGPACWLEKPQVVPIGKHWMDKVQVNFLRRADPEHRRIAIEEPGGMLLVRAKKDIHTICHFEDLAKWWKARLVYEEFSGPCSYIYGEHVFDNGGINPGECMKGMLENLLDAVDGKADLWSPPYND